MTRTSSLEKWWDNGMTDGGKMARRSARVFADEYQLSQEKAPNEGCYSPAMRGRDEKQMERSLSRGSSCSSVSLVNFEMERYAEGASKDSGVEGKTRLCSRRHSAPTDYISSHFRH
jgi:hypothetical protein